MRYIVREPFLAVCDDPPRRFTFVTAETGKSLTVLGEPNRSGLVDVRYEGKIIAAFMRDILARCERAEGHAE
jgi:hypothetical protein